MTYTALPHTNKPKKAYTKNFTEEDKNYLSLMTKVAFEITFLELILADLKT